MEQTDRMYYKSVAEKHHPGVIAPNDSHQVPPPTVDMQLGAAGLGIARLVDAITRLEGIVHGSRPQQDTNCPPQSEDIGIATKIELIAENLNAQVDRMVRCLDVLK
jgi:hypothetical protein